MICKSCNHYNKDTASVCRFCGARLQGEPVKAKAFLKNSQPVRRSNSFINDAPKGEDFLGGNSAYKNNRASFGNTAERQKSSQNYQYTPSVPGRRNVSYNNQSNAKVARDENKVPPKSSTFRNETPKPLKSNVFLHDEAGISVPLEDRHSSKTQEAKEKTAVFQESLFNKKFSSALLLLSLITLISIIAFSFVFIGKNYPVYSAHPSASRSVSSPASAKASPTATALPIATTNPE